MRYGCYKTDCRLTAPNLYHSIESCMQESIWKQCWIKIPIAWNTIHRSCKTKLQSWLLLAFLGIIWGMCSLPTISLLPPTISSTLCAVSGMRMGEKEICRVGSFPRMIGFCGDWIRPRPLSGDFSFSDDHVLNVHCLSITKG